MNKSIKKFKDALKRISTKRNNAKNNALVEGWYNSYQVLEKYAFNDVDKDAMKSELKHQIFNNIGQTKRLWLQKCAVAATIAVALSIGVWMASHERPQRPLVFRTSVTQIGVLKYLLLSDSTEVWVNSSSRFLYPEKFATAKRNVLLPEGEAFFEVKRDTLRPFIVNAGQLEIKVLGTSFNISNYSMLHNQVITVNTGKVQVSNANKVLALLEKGKQITVHKQTGQFVVSEVNQANSFSWKDGNATLTDADFIQLAQVFKSWYGLSLKSIIPQINGFRYTLTIQRNISAEENLKMICKMHHIQYGKEGDVVEFY